ncbi:hypothetical protein [Symbiopectobacterium sp. RP]|uniref:hypothetical protein n=1 Tax=Symbiopectobacterium sp. RP TaxID=3248553 RepID=UPI003D27F46B
MITASYAFLPHIRASVVIIFKSVGYIWWSICLHIRRILTQLSINGHKQKQKKREWLRYRDFVLSPYGVIKIKSLGYTYSAVVEE